MEKDYLELDGLTVSFDGFVAVDGVSLSVLPGELRFLIGPNGAGKTTVFNCVGGFYKPTAGEVMLDDRPIAGLPSHMVARQGLVRTFQNIRLFKNLTVVENLMVAQHRRVKAGLLHRLLATPAYRRAERPEPAAMSRFCSTDSPSNTVAVWKVRPTPSRLLRCTFWPTSSWPA